MPLQFVSRTMLCLPVLLAGGCVSFPWVGPATTETTAAPVAFDALPTLPELIHVVNTNSLNVRSLQTQGASLTVGGYPGLLAELSMERPRRVRLTAKPPLLGGTPMLDLGSNDELFWIFVNDEFLGLRMSGANRSPVLFARHEQFVHSPVHAQVPIEPQRLSDLMGLVYLDPNVPHQGPRPSGTESLEVVSQIPSPRGMLTRVTTIHARYGWVLAQQLLDANGQTLAWSRSTQHRYYADAAASLPHRITIQMAGNQPSMAVVLDVGGYSINELYGSPQELWSLPEFPAQHPRINLADPQVGGMLPVATRPDMPYAPGANYRPRYRGGNEQIQRY